MPYRIYFYDKTADKGHTYGRVNEQEGARVINGQGRPFVQLEDRQGEVYINVSSIYKIEKAGDGEQRPEGIRLG